MKTIFLLTALFPMALLSRVAVAHTDDVQSAKVLSNLHLGVELTIVALKPEGEKQTALLLFRGTNSEFDGKVLPAIVEDDRNQTRYQIQRRGQAYFPLRVELGATPRYRVYYPGRKSDEIQLLLDEAKSRALKPESIYRQFQKQGSLDAITKFNRAEPISAAEKALAQEQEQFRKKCAMQIPFKVDWNTITDDILMDLSVGSYCGGPFEALESLCEESKEAKRTFQSRVKSITCRFGTSQKLELDGQTLNWTTARDASNQTQFVRDYLLKNL